ncbi:MAG TPA: MATE family efflux transporter [Saprospiraceae bacterium]|nr:MATE family efflux transporter [Saprospiraceae bacterium]
MKKLISFFSIVKESLRGEHYDYTQGDVRKAIILLSVPMILELSLESVFAVTDTYFVSKLSNAQAAIATVGLTESLVTIIYTIAIGLSTAGTAMVARRVGEKNYREASRAGAQVLLLGFISSVILSICGYFLAPKLLFWMGASQQVITEGSGFCKVQLGGSSVILFLFLINGIFRGAGDALLAMKSLWLASLINIVLCPFLIFGIGPFPELGLTGAAIATTIGRGIGVLYQCRALLISENIIKIELKDFTWDTTLIKALISIAWPATFQFFVQSGSWIIITFLVASTGGTEASAGYQIAIRNVVFFILPAWGLSNAAATLVGQNLGAKQAERAEQSVLLTMKYNVLFMSVVMIFFLFFAESIIKIFTRDEQLIYYGTKALQIIGSGYVFYGIGMVMIQALNGAGYTKIPSWINLFGFWFFQIPLAYLLAKTLKFGPLGAFIAIPVAETAIALVAYYFFRKGYWKEVKI